MGVRRVASRARCVPIDPRQYAPFPVVHVGVPPEGHLARRSAARDGPLARPLDTVVPSVAKDTLCFEAGVCRADNVCSVRTEQRSPAAHSHVFRTW